MKGHIGVFSMSKNIAVRGGKQLSAHFGAKREALRRRGNVLFNLINRTEIGSLHE